MFLFFKQKTAYEMRISDWSSDVCSSDLRPVDLHRQRPRQGVDQFDRGWNHIGRHLRANEILEVLLARLRPLDDLDHRDRDLAEPAVPDRKDRSDGRCVGKERVRTGRSRSAPRHKKKKILTNMQGKKNT